MARTKTDEQLRQIADQNTALRAQEGQEAGFAQITAFDLSVEDRQRMLELLREGGQAGGFQWTANIFDLLDPTSARSQTAMDKIEKQRQDALRRASQELQESSAFGILATV